MHVKQLTAWQRNSLQLVSYGFGDMLEGIPDLLRMQQHFISGIGQGSCSLFEKGKVPRGKVLLLWRLWLLSEVNAEAVLQHVCCRSKDGCVPAVVQQDGCMVKPVNLQARNCRHWLDRRCTGDALSMDPKIYCSLMPRSLIQAAAKAPDVIVKADV